MSATPVPVVSSRDLLAVVPPNVVRAARPASRGMFVNVTPRGDESCCAAWPDPVRTASAAIAGTARQKARNMAGMLPPQVRGQAVRGLVLGPRLCCRAAAAQRQRELIMRLRVFRREPNGLAKFCDRAAEVPLLQPLASGVH